MKQICIWFTTLFFPILFASSNLNPSTPTSFSINPDSSKASNDLETANDTILSDVLKGDISSASSTITTAKMSSSTSKKKLRKKETSEEMKVQNSRSSQSSSSSTQASTSLRRIKKEYENAVKMGICYDWTKQRLIKPKTKHPSQNTSTGQEHHKLICLGPLASNLRHWHFSFRGCGIYDAGIYHGRILLPKDYPSTPPHVQLWTPSGRFIPFHDICLSASSYHPESWSPRWSVLSLVQALRLHMLTNPQEIGGKSSSLEQTTEYSKLSLAWRLDFHAGKRIISVDHALIIRQGALSIIDDDDSPSLSESTKEEIEDPLADSSPQKPELEESFQSEASIEQAVAFKPKIKRKKRSKKANKGGSSAVAFKQKEQIRRSSKLTLLHSVILALVKVLASPLRFGLFSFVLLYFLII